jgi:ribosomal protein S24E
MRDPLVTADIRDAMAASYQQAQEEVAVDRIAQVFGNGVGNVRKRKCKCTSIRLLKHYQESKRYPKP